MGGARYQMPAARAGPAVAAETHAGGRGARGDRRQPAVTIGQAVC